MKNLPLKHRKIIFNIGIILFAILTISITVHLILNTEIYYLPNQSTKISLGAMLLLLAFCLLLQNLLFTKEELTDMRPSPKAMKHILIAAAIYFVFCLILFAYIEQKNLWESFIGRHINSVPYFFCLITVAISSVDQYRRKRNKECDNLAE